MPVAEAAVLYIQSYFCDMKDFKLFWCGFYFFLSSSRCVELIIYEQMNKYKIRLKDISTLEFAENKAKKRLTFIRRSMVRLPIINESVLSGSNGYSDSLAESPWKRL